MLLNQQKSTSFPVGYLQGYKKPMNYKSRSSNSSIKTGISNYIVDKQFKPQMLAEDILANYMTAYYDGQILYCYKDGVYIPGGEMVFKKIAHDLLGIDVKKNCIEEALYLAKIQATLSDRNMINPDDGLLNIRNGLLNWRTGKIVPHSKDRISTVQYPIIYEPYVRNESVENFLYSIVSAETVDTLTEIIGYCLLPNTKYEKAFMFTGTGANGKSTFINMLTSFLGRENVSNIELQDLENHKFKVAELKDKSLNTFADISHRGLVKSSIFKSVVSGDRLTAERKNKDPFEFTPFAKLIFSANELPKSSDFTDGFFRRLLIIPFENKFTPGKADVNLLEKITSPNALSALLNLALEGLLRLDLYNKFTETDQTIAALQKYRKDTDNVANFMDECCLLDECNTYGTKKMYEEYQKWSHESGLFPLGKIKFNNRLETQYGLTKKRFKGEKSERWIGISVRS
ncbi:DNA primase family protein [Paenibacillus sp. MMO-58]|uniref:DNA primase family protein n=1 Tax=Paenibacillus sp. MMO-58 TaxID=3081290 RepID=UPI0030188CF4